MALLVSSCPCICSALVQVSDTSVGYCRLVIQVPSIQWQRHQHPMSSFLAALVDGKEPDRPNDPSLEMQVQQKEREMG